MIKASVISTPDNHHFPFGLTPPPPLIPKPTPNDTPFWNPPFHPLIYFPLLFSEGKRHDAGMLRDSGLLDDLQNHAISPTGEVMCLYGDPAYPLRVNLQAPFRDARLTPAMEAYNLAMSRVRTSVEWIFGDVIKSFKALDFKSNLKIGLSTVGKMYVVCALMRNAITCMYGNQTCDFFGLEPPTINEYFS